MTTSSSTLFHESRPFRIWWLRPVCYVLPTTYAVEAVRSVTLRGWGLDKIYPDVVALLIFAGVFLILATIILRRRE